MNMLREEKIKRERVRQDPMRMMMPQRLLLLLSLLLSLQL